MKRKLKPQKVKVEYTQVEMTEEGQKRVDRAFDILFDQVSYKKSERARKEGS